MQCLQAGEGEAAGNHEQSRMRTSMIVKLWQTVSSRERTGRTCQKSRTGGPNFCCGVFCHVSICTSPEGCRWNAKQTNLSPLVPDAGSNLPDFHRQLGAVAKNLLWSLQQSSRPSLASHGNFTNRWRLQRPTARRYVS